MKPLLSARCVSWRMFNEQHLVTSRVLLISHLYTCFRLWHLTIPTLFHKSSLLQVLIPNAMFTHRCTSNLVHPLIGEFTLPPQDSVTDLIDYWAEGESSFSPGKQRNGGKACGCGAVLWQERQTNHTLCMWVPLALSPNSFTYRAEAIPQYSTSGMNGYDVVAACLCTRTCLTTRWLWRGCPMYFLL